MNRLLLSASTAALMLLALNACGQSEQADQPGTNETSAEETVAAASDMSDQGPPPLALPSQDDMAMLLDGFSVPGASMALISDCRLDDVQAYGTANLETGQPVTTDTLFEAASMTKPVFAWIVMTLVDEGTIDLDATIADELDYPRIIDQEAYQDLTPRMVLTHRTGLPNWSGESLDFDRTDPLAFSAVPGEQFTYSGEAFQILQAYVEQKTGKDLQALFDERLGETMPQSTFVPPFPEGTELSVGYQSSQNPGTARPLREFPEPQSAGGLITTASDFARFLGVVCRHEGMSEETWQEMMRPQSVISGGQAEGRYSLGWAILEVGGTTIIGHDGNNGEYRTAGFFSPDYLDGLVFLSNGANGTDMFNMMMEPPPAE